MKKSLKKITEKSKILIEKIRNELNIDIEQYQTNDIFNKITKILFIQKYAFTNILKPVIVTTLLYILGFFILDLTTIQYFIYGVFCLIIIVPLGIFIGIVFLIKNLKKDLLSITQQSTVLLEKIYIDLCNTNANNIEKYKNPLTLIFEGVLVGLVHPKIASSYINIPIIGNIINNGVEKTTPFLIENFRKQEEKLNMSGKIENAGNTLLNKVEKSKTIINLYLEKSETIIDKSFSTIAFPLYTITIIFTLILLIFIFLIN